MRDEQPMFVQPAPGENQQLLPIPGARQFHPYGARQGASLLFTQPMEPQRLTGQLLVFEQGVAPPVHGTQRRQIRCRHGELFAEMAPQDGGHNAHGIEDLAAQPQKADRQRQSQLQGGSPATRASRGMLARSAYPECVETKSCSRLASTNTGRSASADFQRSRTVSYALRDSVSRCWMARLRARPR